LQFQLKGKIDNCYRAVSSRSCNQTQLLSVFWCSLVDRLKCRLFVEKQNDMRLFYMLVMISLHLLYNEFTDVILITILTVKISLIIEIFNDW